MTNQLNTPAEQLGTGEAATSYSGLGSQAGLAVQLSGQLAAISGYNSTASTVGTTLTVTYNFTTNVSNGCTNATLSLAAVGIMLVTEPPQVIVVANGEQVEISPALPELTATQSPYVVTLVVTNSDGLVGTRAIDYSPPV